jgi:hypothetical protein
MRSVRSATHPQWQLPPTCGRSRRELQWTAAPDVLSGERPKRTRSIHVTPRSRFPSASWLTINRSMTRSVSIETPSSLDSRVCSDVRGDVLRPRLHQAQEKLAHGAACTTDTGVRTVLWWRVPTVRIASSSIAQKPTGVEATVSPLLSLDQDPQSRSQRYSGEQSGTVPNRWLHPPIKISWMVLHALQPMSTHWHH